MLHFLQLEGSWHLRFEQVCWCHFPATFDYFPSLCHIIIILATYQTFLFVLYWFWWPVITDLWCYCCNCLGHYKPCSHETANLVNNAVCVLMVSLAGGSPISLPLWVPSYSLRQNSTKIVPINNPTMTSKCSNKRKSLMSVTLNQKLKMITLIKKKDQPCVSLLSCKIKGKVLERNWKC